MLVDCMHKADHHGAHGRLRVQGINGRLYFQVSATHFHYFVTTLRHISLDFVNQTRLPHLSYAHVEKLGGAWERCYMPYVSHVHISVKFHSPELC